MNEISTGFRDSKNRLCTAIIVDDEVIDRMTLKRIFNKFACNNPVLEAVNGAKALELLEGLSPEDLSNNSYIIFMDINMPLMDGFECIEQISANSNLSHIPVFMITTSGSNFDMSKAEKSGVLAFFNKFDLSENAEQFFSDVSSCCSYI